MLLAPTWTDPARTTAGESPAPLTVLVVDGLEAVLRVLDGVQTAAEP